MCAFVYGLNDCDERVRYAAACAIVSELKQHPCCCSDKVAGALMCALGDCDKHVVKAATKGLCLCGYEVSNCCSTGGCSTGGCNSGCNKMACAGGPACCTSAPATVPATAPTMEESVAPPAPPAAEPEAYFPSRLRDQQTKKTVRNSLSNLFGMRN